MSEHIQKIEKLIQQLPSGNYVDTCRLIYPECVSIRDSGKHDELRLACDLLITKLNSPSDVVRQMAVEALGVLADTRAVIPLTTLLRDEDISVAGYASDSLGKIRDPRAVPALIEAMTRWLGTSNCGRAAEALGRIGDGRAIQPLREILHNLEAREKRDANTVSLGKWHGLEDSVSKRQVEQALEKLSGVHG